MDRIIGDRGIDAPKAGKPPLQVNVFHALRSANTTLMTIFPYVGDGDLVPGATVFWGGEDRDTGVFLHENTVDEVAITLAAAKSRMRPGFVHVGSRKHMVGRYFEDPSDPEIMMVIVVTQRQSEGMPQSEVWGAMCENCQEPLLLHTFDSRLDDKYAATDANGEPVHLPGFYPPLETTMESCAAAEMFNESEAVRTCKKCGTVNAPFPLHVWGWDSFVKNTIAVERGRAIMAAAALN